MNEISKFIGRTFGGPRQLRPRCSARTASGIPCRAQALKPSGRCFRHGGLSTGPKTPEGKARQRAAAREAMRRVWQERREGKRPMPMISERQRAKLRERSKARTEKLREIREAALAEARRRRWWEELHDRTKEKTAARKENARQRQAKRMRRYRAETKI